MKLQESPLSLSTQMLLAAKVIDGGLAGVTGVTATFPLDLSKTRLQKQVVPQGQQPYYKNMLQTIRLVAKNEGFLGLYSGYKVNVSFIVFVKGIQLVGNDVSRKHLTDKKTGEISLHVECLAGAGIGALQSALSTPMELLKIKGQVAASKGLQFNTFKTMSEILKREGPRGFYRGWCSTLVRETAFGFLYLPLYANLKNTETFGNGDSFRGNLAAGMVAGAISGGLSTPTDVVKTRLQDLPIGQKMSWVECVKMTYQQEGGIRPFYKGALPRMVCIGSLFAVAQAFYELGIGKKILAS